MANEVKLIDYDDQDEWSAGPIQFSWGCSESDRDEKAEVLRREIKKLKKKLRRMEAEAANRRAADKKRRKAARLMAKRQEAALDRLAKIVKDGSDDDAIRAARELLS